MEHVDIVEDTARPPTPQRTDGPSCERLPFSDGNISLASAETERSETNQSWYEICIEEEREERERQEQREREAREMRDRAAAATARRMERRALANSDAEDKESPEAAVQLPAKEVSLIDLLEEPKTEQTARVANPFALGLIYINTGLERLAAETTLASPRQLGVCTPMPCASTDEPMKVEEGMTGTASETSHYLPPCHRCGGVISRSLL